MKVSTAYYVVVLLKNFVTANVVWTNFFIFLRETLLFETPKMVKKVRTQGTITTKPVTASLKTEVKLRYSEAPFVWPWWTRGMGPRVKTQMLMTIMKTLLTMCSSAPHRLTRARSTEQKNSVVTVTKALV